MVSRLSHLTIDAHDAYAQSVWWSHVLGYTEDVKQVKTRLHLDLRPADGDRDTELARLLELGATEVDDRRLPDGRGWVVLADPEGNEFCILRSVEEMQG